MSDENDEQGSDAGEGEADVTAGGCGEKHTGCSSTSLVPGISRCGQENKHAGLHTCAACSKTF